MLCCLAAPSTMNTPYNNINDPTRPQQYVGNVLYSPTYSYAPAPAVQQVAQYQVATPYIVLSPVHQQQSPVSQNAIRAYNVQQQFLREQNMVYAGSAFTPGMAISPNQQPMFQQQQQQYVTQQQPQFYTQQPMQMQQIRPPMPPPPPLYMHRPSIEHVAQAIVPSHALQAEREDSKLPFLSIPTRLNNLRLDEAAKPKPRQRSLPSTFYPSSRDVVVDRFLHPRGGDETSFPGKNEQFDALIASSLPKLAHCQTDAQISELALGIVTTILSNNGFFVSLQVTSKETLWKKVELADACAFCMQCLHQRSSGTSRSPIKKPKTKSLPGKTVRRKGNAEPQAAKSPVRQRKSAKPKSRDSPSGATLMGYKFKRPKEAKRSDHDPSSSP
jgi:hypothetical protein